MTPGRENIGRTVENLIEFLSRYGYVLLFVFVAADQMGLPLPAMPALMAIGAMTHSGSLDLLPAIGVAVLAALVSDLIRFRLGRRWGGRFLGLLCKISMEPDSCVRRTEDLVSRHGARSLLFAKFLPGFHVAAPPLAGMIGVSPGRFLLFDGMGALLWAGLLIGLGRLFGQPLLVAVEEYSAWGGGALAVLVVGLVIFLAAKFHLRRRFIRRLRTARVTAHELKEMLDGPDRIALLDLRHEIEVQQDPGTIPGALFFNPEELERRHSEIPRDQDIILFCT